jgi:PIN domain nuclease of toxin-antitoxin system
LEGCGAGRVIFLDTHSWIWWLDQSSHLSPSAERVLDKISKKNPALISSISVWELYMLVKKGRLVLRTDPAHWVHQCELSPEIRFVPVDNEIARISVQLPSEVHEDPADRLIIASAISLGATLITKDQKIRSSKVVQTIW